MPSLSIDIHAKAQIRVLASLLGKSTSVIYDFEKSGRLPSPIIDHSYIECINHAVSYLTKGVEVKIAKVASEEAIKIAKIEAKTTNGGSYRTAEGEDGELHPLIAAKTIQAIKVDKARETQLWVKTSIERGNYVSLPRLQEIIEPFFLSIRQTLLELALEGEEAQHQVDTAMKQLHTAGVNLANGAVIDSEAFIDLILEKELDTEAIQLEAAPAILL